MAQSEGVIGKGPSSPWLAGAHLIDKLLDSNHPCHKVLTEDESNGLANIKKLLVSSHITQNHIPVELTNDPEHGHLAEQFGGVRKKVNFKKAAKSVLNGLKFIKTAQGLASLKAQTRQSPSVKGYLPPEWHNLSISRKSYVYRLLSYDALKKWSYDSLELSVACGENPLLFLGWAIICAPHAQRAMADSLGLERPDIKDDDVYEFVDEFRMTPESCINFLRLTENDYNPNVGYLVTYAGIRFPGLEDAPSGFAAFDNIRGDVMGQFGMTLVFMEIANRDQTGNAEFPGDFRNGALDFGWDSQSDAWKANKRAIELNNGRAAQMGILGLMVHEKLGNLNEILPAPGAFAP